MTASLDDADDLLQETLFRAWRSLGTYGGRSSFRAWLYRIATNRTLDVVSGKAWRDLRTSPTGEFAEDPPWLQPYPTADPDQTTDPEMTVAEREAIGLAYLVACQALPPRQRASLILCEVLGFSARECAEILSCSVAAVNSALQRARRSLKTPPEPQAETDEERRVVDEFVAAWKQDDVEALVDLIADDGVLTMPPDPLTVLGGREIAAFFREAFAGSLRAARLVACEANAQPAFATYLASDTGEVQLRGLLVLTVRRGRITKLTGFGDPALIDAFPHQPPVGRGNDGLSR